MELREKLAKVIIIGGLSRAGKDTVADFMKEYYESVGFKTIKIQFASYIKMYAREISNWDGSEETKPRSLLQELGTEIIRNRIDKYFFINRIIEDIKVYSFFYDIIIISDARVREEIINVKEVYDGSVSINVVRPNYDNLLTDKEKMHLTETGLNGFDQYDYRIINDSDLESLKNKSIDIAKIIGGEEK